MEVLLLVLRLQFTLIKILFNAQVSQRINLAIQMEILFHSEIQFGSKFPLLQTNLLITKFLFSITLILLITELIVIQFPKILVIQS